MRAIKHSNNKISIAHNDDPSKGLINASLKTNAERDVFILLFKHMVSESEQAKLRAAE